MWNRATDARRPPVSPSQQPAQEQPDLSALIERLAEVQASLAAMRPAYEYTGPRTFGGPPGSGPFQLASPFTGPCEVAVVLWINTDSSQATGVLSTTPGVQTSIASTAKMTDTLPGTSDFLMVGTVFGDGSVPPPLTWYPLVGNATLYLTTGSAQTNTGGLYVTVQFRRRINPAGVPNVGYP